MGANYSFELIYIVHGLTHFIGHNKFFLGSVFALYFFMPKNIHEKLWFGHLTKILMNKHYIPCSVGVVTEFVEQSSERLFLSLASLSL